MSEQTDLDVVMRSQALDLACRVVDQGSPPGHFLSTARQFARYMLTGLSQTGPNNAQTVEVATGTVMVRVDGMTTDTAQVAKVTAAVREALS